MFVQEGHDGPILLTLLYLIILLYVFILTKSNKGFYLIVQKKDIKGIIGMVSVFI
jgi:hypothetical protein